MNDRKFLGLLNLYLDGEIDPDSAAGLEREILSNPRRRAVYGEYCRIHRATKLVYERFRNAAADQEAGGMQALRQNVFSADEVSGENGMAEAAGRGPWRSAAYWLGGVAAACAAAYAVFLYAPRQDEPNRPPALATTTPAPKPAALVETAATTPPTTIPAPFATEFRLDPFVTDRPFDRRDPFSFSSAPISARIESGFAPAPITTFHLQSNADPARTNIRGLSLQPAGAVSPDARVFRQTSDGKPVNFEPVGFKIQR